jgi:hypothetical protein
MTANMPWAPRTRKVKFWKTWGYEVGQHAAFRGPHSFVSTGLACQARSGTHDSPPSTYPCGHPVVPRLGFSIVMQRGSLLSYYDLWIAISSFII